MLSKHFRIIQHHINTSYADMHIIVLTRISYANSYIKVLNDLCLCTKRLYTFFHYIMPHHITILLTIQQEQQYYNIYYIHLIQSFEDLIF